MLLFVAIYKPTKGLVNIMPRIIARKPSLMQINPEQMKTLKLQTVHQPL